MIPNNAGFAPLPGAGALPSAWRAMEPVTMATMEPIMGNGAILNMPKTRLKIAATSASAVAGGACVIPGGTLLVTSDDD